MAAVLTVVKTGAKAGKVEAVQPASTFAELLRRSRFASYDPAIAQTYTAPPASARRGNYGLKRPIPMPYKDSYITVPTFEHHAQFADWNNAEKQVKFVRRIEETNVLPEPWHDSSWDRALGNAQTQWVIDSEFGGVGPAVTPVAPAVPLREIPPHVQPQEPDDTKESPDTQDLDQHSYATALQGVQLNVHSLSPKQFQRYLSKLRKLGPEFRAYLAEHYKKRYISQIKARASEKNKELPTPETLELVANREIEHLLYVAAQTPVHKLHRQFLSKVFSKNYSEDKSEPSMSSIIEAQPHRAGGLVYTRPSKLQTILTSSPLPGLVLQDSGQTASQFAKERLNPSIPRQASDRLVLFGDFLAKMLTKNAAAANPVYHPDTPAGVVTGDPLTSTGSSKPTPNLRSFVDQFRYTKYVLRELPKVVSYKTRHQRPMDLLNEMNLLAEVIPDQPWSKRNQDNPHTPGSPLYISHVSTGVSGRRILSPVDYGSEMAVGENSIGYGSAFARKQEMDRQRRNMFGLMNSIEQHTKAPGEVRDEMRSMGMGMGMGKRDEGVQSVDNEKTLLALKSMMPKSSGNRDEDVDEDEES